MLIEAFKDQGVNVVIVPKGKPPVHSIPPNVKGMIYAYHERSNVISQYCKRKGDEFFPSEFYLVVEVGENVNEELEAQCREEESRYLEAFDNLKIPRSRVTAYVRNEGQYEDYGSTLLVACALVGEVWEAMDHVGV